MKKYNLPIEIVLQISSYLEKCDKCGKYTLNKYNYCDNACYFTYKKTFILTYIQVLILYLISIIYLSNIHILFLTLIPIILSEQLFY